ncbi:class I SAM-dependent methyltransferase [Mycolicibacterium bacteremicum]|uniref:SAM-dependent methyltransferase n=1 Tax=Mycolicibacterium bacteremicum TaxID=564198 RepID=A0A1W9Z280_MYCBA|nr:SAM-dependent methyltransferase [Mycolicibacterium bacteremicum]MCV7433141.1 SAM-dependent methyltransferase [Mycolicibacterium bacteremicum]ORA06292.1 SAM-dependent methyltransferase [Mycolicibacterium bacteremicum]
MPESSVVVRPVPVGSGDYSAASRLQAAGLARAIRLFEDAAAAIPIPRAPLPIVIADYGAANGHNSLLPLNAAITVLRKRTRPEHSVLVTHTDVPENDFSALFRVLREDPDSYLRHDTATFSSAVGRSYYQQILPANTVSLGWSSWSILWLSSAPAAVPDHVHAWFSSDDAIRSAHARLAARDWHEFVAYRGRELCPGGRAVVMTMAVAEDGEFGYRPLFAALMAELAEQVARGVLTDEELGAMSIPIAGRRAVDFTTPFAPSGRLEQLTIEHLDVFDAEDRFWRQHQKDGDARAFGAQWGAFLQATLIPVLAGFVAPERRASFGAALEAGVAARLAADPQEMQIPMAQVVLHKKPRS